MKRRIAEASLQGELFSRPEGLEGRGALPFESLPGG